MSLIERRIFLFSVVNIFLMSWIATQIQTLTTYINGNDEQFIYTYANIVVIVPKQKQNMVYKN